MVHHSVLPGDSQQAPVKLKLPSVSPPPPVDQAIKIELICKAKSSDSQDQQEVKFPDLPIEKDPVTTAEPHSQPHTDLSQPKSLTAIPSNQQLVNNTTVQHNGILTSVSHKTTTEKSRHNKKRVRYVRSRDNVESRLSKGWTHPVPIEPLHGHVVPCVHVPTGGRTSTEHGHERVDTPSSVNVDISQILQET